jgi:hypothetical protein
MKMEQIECSETSVYKIQTPGNYPEENIQHTEHGESLKSKKHHSAQTSPPEPVRISVVSHVQHAQSISSPLFQSAL